MSRNRQARSRFRRRESFPVRVELLEERLPPGTVLALPGVPWAELSLGWLNYPTAPLQTDLRLLPKVESAFTQSSSLRHFDYLANPGDEPAFFEESSSQNVVVQNPPSPALAGSTPAAAPTFFAWQAFAAWDLFADARFADALAADAPFPAAPARTAAARPADEEATRAQGSAGGLAQAAPEAFANDSTSPMGLVRPSGTERGDALLLTVAGLPPAGRGGDGPRGPVAGGGPLAAAVSCSVVQSLTIVPSTNYSTSTKVETTSNLTNGVLYTVFAYGDFLASPSGGKRADAEFYDFNSPSTDYSGVDVGLKLTGVTVGNPVWGNLYNPDHSYSALVTGLGGKLGVYYEDATPSDNSGQLVIEIYQTDCLAPDIPPD